MDWDLFLAVAALFGAGFALSSHAEGSDGGPTTADVATVLGQGTVVAGKSGGLNGLARYLPSVHDFAGQNLANDVRAHYEQQVGTHLRNSLNAPFEPPQFGEEVVQSEFAGNSDAASIRAEFAGDYRGPSPENYRQMRKRTPDEVQASFAPTVRILSAALAVVEWGAMPLFGSCCGVYTGDLGNVDGPDRGGQIGVSTDQYATGYGRLAYAYPDQGHWSGASAAEYAADETIMLSLAAQAGVDGLVPLVTDADTAVNTLAQGLIAHQANQVEMMMQCLAAVGVGLMLCIAVALYLGGMSWQFQLTMAGLGVGAAAAIVGVMAGKWTSANVADLTAVARAYTALAAQVPAAVPPAPPSAVSSTPAVRCAAPVRPIGAACSWRPGEPSRSGGPA